jgi:hypothetical protein
LSALLTQFLPNFVSSLTTTHETINILVFTHKTTNKNCRKVGDQQAIDSPHIVNGKRTSTAQGVPTQSRDPQWRLTPCVCCWYLCPQHHVLR